MTPARGCSVFVVSMLVVALGRLDLARAGIRARGGDELISAYVTGVQRRPAIAPTDSGAFLVVWEEERPDVEGTHIFGSIRSPARSRWHTDPGPFQVDSEGSSRNELPGVVRTADQEYVVVWRRDPNDGGMAHVMGARVDVWGNVLGTEFRVDSDRDPGDDYLGGPSVASASDGSFVVVWASGQARHDDFYGSTSDVFARRFTRDALPVGGEAVVGTPGGGESDRAEIRPDVARTSDGGFLVAWAKGVFGGFGSQFETRARHLDSLGQPAGAEIAVGQGGLVGPRLATRGSGGFSVAWSTFEYIDYIPGFRSEVRARGFDESGQPIGTEWVASSPAVGLDPQGDPLRPFAGAEGVAATIGQAGELVVAWTSGPGYAPEYYGGSRDGDGSGIFGRLSTNDGAPLGAVSQLNAAAAGDQVRPSVAAASDGSFMVVWEAGHIYGRRFDVVISRCGDADDGGSTLASDALITLQAAVGTRVCELCQCDADASGGVTASDALAVLRAALDPSVVLACPRCRDDFAVNFDLQADAACYGVRAYFPYSVTIDPSISCEIDPRVTAAGCTAGFDAWGYSDFTFDARDCFLEDGPLFRCHVSATTAAAMTRGASVQTCGCAETCAEAPVVCVAPDEERTCSMPAGASQGPVDLR